MLYGEMGRDIARERERFAKDARPGDTLWLPSLKCLVLPAKARPERYRPGADLAATIADLCARGVRIIDASADVSTDNPAAWGAHVKRVVAGAAMIDRKQPVKRASGPKEDGVVTLWRSKAMADRLKVQRAIWTAAGRIDDVLPLLDSELQRLGQRTLYNILGRRRPHDKRAGGRPRKET